jgi:nitrite reductase (NO-forming)
MHRTRVLAAAALLTLVTAACSSAAKPGWTWAPAADSPGGTPGTGQVAASHAPAATTAPGTGAPGDVLGSLEITAVDLGFQPGSFTVAQPGKYEIRLSNTGSIIHDVTFPDGTAIVAESGQTASAVVDVPADGLAFLCSIPGHKDAGMVGTISVEGSAESGSSGGDHGGPAPATDVQPDAAAPAYTVHDPRAPARLSGTTHDIDLVIEEKEMTVAEGFVQRVWTFGGTVPGPVIRVQVGDTVRIHLKNPATSQLPHSVDFHSSLVAWNDEMTSIDPGEYAGVWMYHCGTAPALHHIANGMYGMMIVEPRGGLDPVDQEFAFVQSEWYLGPQKEPASLTKAAAAAPEPDYVLFNGVANQYLDNPIQIETGKRVRAFILDAGPSIDSSFHIVGTIFDRVVKEGIELEVGNAGTWGSQAVDLSPAQGAIVEFTMAEDGLYPIVTHAFNFVGRGALGLFQAGDGDPKN